MKWSLDEYELVKAACTFRNDQSMPLISFRLDWRGCIAADVGGESGRMNAAFPLCLLKRSEGLKQEMDFWKRFIVMDTVSRPMIDQLPLMHVNVSLIQRFVQSSEESIQMNHSNRNTVYICK